MGHYWHVKTRDQATAFADWIFNEQEAGRERLFEIIEAHRTTKQNAALHSMFRRLSKRLNDSGFDITHPLNNEIGIPWSEESVKELLFKPVMKSMFNKISTKKLTSEELTKLVDVTLNRIAEITDVVEGFTLEESNLLNGD